MPGASCRECDAPLPDVTPGLRLWSLKEGNYVDGVQCANCGAKQFRGA